jgi:glycosyltransferase involved in cell wall biosynthesis
VLLPTRNRLELLKYAIETVRRQDYEDWEVIVSDNDSEEDVQGYIRSLDEPRIKYYRTNEFVSVTDNWNNALEKSSGDYIIMLGDDDCLMKRYFTRIKDLAETYDNPDFIYTNAFIYAYPGVMPDFPDGFLQLYKCDALFNTAKEPYWLGHSDAMGLVHKSMNFEVPFAYNMQHSVISRRFLDSLGSRGPFFQSPYPDFYASLVMFLKAKRILIYPQPLVIIGVSPKSFGFYFAHNREKEGTAFLKNTPDPETLGRLKDVILPGMMIRTPWLIALDSVKLNYGNEFDLQVNYNRYRYLQIIHSYGKYYNDKYLKLDTKESEESLRELWGLMRWWEKICYAPLLTAVSNLAGLVPKGIRKKVIVKIMGAINKTPQLDTDKTGNHYKNILEVFEALELSGDRYPSK